MRSLYIHIPFCKQKCLYCDFNSYSGKENLIEEYIEALKKEIIKYGKTSYETVYFGGGTPSIIHPKYIESILSLLMQKENALKDKKELADKNQTDEKELALESQTAREELADKKEITLEVNPGTINIEKLRTYKRIGINRLSIGLQATQNSILKEIGRIHTFEDFDETFKMARKEGFTNINVDLMFGLPNQTLKDIEESLDYIIKINPEHISCYSLILHNNIFKNLPTDDEERNMYYKIIEKLTNAGYKHYEISNFAKPGYESKHNLGYWNQQEYVGVGAGASSYIDNKRYTNELSIEKYIEKINKNIQTYEIEEVQNKISKMKEYMILRLRLIEGVSVKKFYEKFHENALELYKKEIEKMQKLNLLEVVNNADLNCYIRLTKKGLDFANVVWEEFV